MSSRHFSSKIMLKNRCDSLAFRFDAKMRVAAYVACAHESNDNMP